METQNIYSNKSYGQLYIVATPIGNLQDISSRAIKTLKNVDLIAAEDTRHSGHLLKQLDIDTHCIALHEHNERHTAEKVVQQIINGQSIALISDAGTPLVSDPGYHLVKLAHQKKIQVEFTKMQERYNFIVINGNRTVPSVSRDLQRHLGEFLQ